MATFSKIKNRWRAQVRRRGVSKSATFSTKSQAVQWANQQEFKIDEGQLNKFERGKDKLVRDAFMEYGRRVTIHKPSNNWEQRRLLWLCKQWIADLKVHEVDTPDMARWRDERMLLVSPSTIVRDFNLISHVFTVASKEWKWLPDNPCSGMTRPEENAARNRRVSAEEIERMRFVLNYEQDTIPETLDQLVCNMWLISLETGMRLSEVNRVGPDTFHEHESYVQIEKSKNGDARKALCNRRALDLLKLRIQAETSATSKHLSAVFSKAVIRAAIEDLHYHDSRHEAITRMAPKLDVLALAKSVGVRDLKTLLIYYEEDTATAAAKLD